MRMKLENIIRFPKIENFLSHNRFSIQKIDKNGKVNKITYNKLNTTIENNNNEFFKYFCYLY